VLKDIVTATRHMVHNGVSVDTDSVSSACLDHVAELFAGATTALKLVGSGLVVEVPRVEFTLLRPLVREDRFADWEDFDAHPALLGKVLALLLNVSVRPAEHLDDGALLAILVNIRLVDLGTLPNEVHCLGGDREGVASIVNRNLKGERGVAKRSIGLVGVAVLHTLAVPVELNGLDAGVLAATGRDGGRGTVRIVLDMVVAHDAAEALVGVFVVGGAGQVSLEGAIGPFSRLIGLLTRGALQVLEIGAVLVL